MRQQASAARHRERVQDDRPEPQRSAQRHQPPSHRRAGGVRVARREPAADAELRHPPRRRPAPGRRPRRRDQNATARSWRPAAPSNLTAQALTHTAVLLQVDRRLEQRDHVSASRARSGGGAFQEVGERAGQHQILRGGRARAVDPLRLQSAGAQRRRATRPTPTSPAPPPLPAPRACVRDDNTACLLNGKFRITGEMKNFDNPPQTFALQVMDFPGGRAESNQASFWESFNAGNFEIAIKMLDACSTAAGPPPAHLLGVLRWLDRQAHRHDGRGHADRCSSSRSTIPPTRSRPRSPTPWRSPAPARARPAPARADATTACLLGGRFKVTGSMRDAQNQVFTTKVMQFPGALSVSRGTAPRPIRPRSSSRSAGQLRDWREDGRRLLAAAGGSAAVLLDLLRRAHQRRRPRCARFTPRPAASTSGATRRASLPTTEGRTMAFPVRSAV